MARNTTAFTGFDPYKLTGVRVTDRELGHGSYATVLELEYMGLKCAGKKIHELLLKQSDSMHTLQRFGEECTSEMSFTTKLNAKTFLVYDKIM